MLNKTNDVLRTYLELNNLDADLYTEAELGQPPLQSADPAPVPAAVEPAPVETKTMSDEAFVSAVKTMIELLSYGINAPESVLHRNPVAKIIKMKNEVTQDNAYDVLDEIENLLATDSPNIQSDI